MKKRRLKAFVVPVFSAVFCSILVLTIILLNTEKIDNNSFTYVSDSIIDDAVSVIYEEENNDMYVIRPYQSDQINIYKKFYDENNKENSIIYFNDTYMQSTGIIYSSNEEFNVVSILNGEVIDITKDNFFGYVVTIKHDNNLVSLYEGLSSVNVNKGDNVLQSTIIGKSGEISLDIDLKNALLFELTKDGMFVNPERYYDRNINEL